MVVVSLLGGVVGLLVGASVWFAVWHVSPIFFPGLSQAWWVEEGELYINFFPALGKIVSAVVLPLVGAYQGAAYAASRLRQHRQDSEAHD